MQKLIRTGTFIDGTLNNVKSKQDILVENGRIAAIADQGTLKCDQAIIEDYSAYTLLPGLIDLHAHICYITEGKFQDSPRGLNRVDMILRGFQNAKAWLKQGVTTIRVLGTPFDLDIGLKEIINENPELGSRLIVAGRMLTMTGGKRTATDYMKDEVTGANNARRWARLHMKEGAEVIKLYATTLQESNVDDYVKRQLALKDDSIDTGRWGSLTIEEIKAVVTEAHKIGRTVAAHTAPSFGIKLALKGGVDTIEHGSDLDEECIELFLKTKATLVPTLSVGYHQFDKGEELGLPTHFIEFAQRRWEKNQKMIKIAYDAGVNIATGTDGFILEKMEFPLELELLCDLGLTPLEAINCATEKAANCLGLAGKDLGALTEGKFADFILVKNDPSLDIKNLREILAVYKAGEKVFDQQGGEDDD